MDYDRVEHLVFMRKVSGIGNLERGQLGEPFPASRAVCFLDGFRLGIDPLR
jgi:hypothetical protein